MMKKLTFLFAMAATALGAFCSPQDDLTEQKFPEQTALKKLVENTHIIGLPEVTVKGDSVYRLVSRFYVDQFRNFQDPKAPYFMLVSKNADVAMGVGGAVRLRGWYGWNGNIPANGFTPYLIPIPKNPTAQRALDATPAGTCIYATVMVHRSSFGTLKGYIEANFNGYQHMDFKLKKAYVTINDWTAGYVTSTFCDPAALAPTIDGAGANGKTDRSNLLVRYLHTFRGDHWSVAGSFEFPKSYQSLLAGVTESCSDYVPDLAAMGQYQWHGGLSHVRLSGLFRSMHYRDVITSQNHGVVGWGTMLSAMVKVLRPLTLYGSVTYGRGQGSYQGDLNVANYDLVNSPDERGHMYAPASLGITAGARWFFAENIYACGVFGMSRYYRRTQPDDDEYRRGIYAAANLFWDITPRLQCGVEYLFGRRDNFNGQNASASRVDALFQLSF